MQVFNIGVCKSSLHQYSFKGASPHFPTHNA